MTVGEKSIMGAVFVNLTNDETISRSALNEAFEKLEIPEKHKVGLKEDVKIKEKVPA